MHLPLVYTSLGKNVFKLISLCFFYLAAWIHDNTVHRSELPTGLCVFVHLKTCWSKSWSNLKKNSNSTQQSPNTQVVTNGQQWAKPNFMLLEGLWALKLSKESQRAGLIHTAEGERGDSAITYQCKNVSSQTWCLEMNSWTCPRNYVSSLSSFVTIFWKKQRKWKCIWSLGIQKSRSGWNEVSDFFQVWQRKTFPSHPGLLWENRLPKPQAQHKRPEKSWETRQPDFVVLFLLPRAAALPTRQANIIFALLWVNA